MLSRSQQKLIQSLRLQKYRLEEGLFIAEGVKMVDELLRSNFGIRQIFATEEWIKTGHLHPDRYLVEIVEISPGELEKISALTTPNQVVALGVIPSVKPVPDITGEWVLMLDQIRDPGNFGTIVRTADWFGIDRIIAANNSVDIWNAKVIQSSMGSVFRMKVHYADLSGFLFNYRQKLPVYGTLLEGEPIEQTSFNSCGIVVIGNESHGISNQIMPYITSKIKISAASVSSGNKAESLNASIATAIICYEIRKQYPANPGMVNNSGHG